MAMELKNIVLISEFFWFLALVEVQGHGRCIQPVHRGGAFRLGFKTPANYDDHEGFCGGVGIQYGRNKGQCGACGDNWAARKPRPNENGGIYGRGVIVKTYSSGQTIEAIVELTQSHRGYFEFALCPLKGARDIETEECFAKHLLRQPNGDTRFSITKSGAQKVKVTLQLPRGFTCQHCSFRWHYRAGNSWGICDDGTGRLGCGNQEIFRTCSDIRIQ